MARPAKAPSGRARAAAPAFEQALVLQEFLAAKLGGNPLAPNDPTHAIRDVQPGSNSSGPSPFLQAFLPFRAFVGPFALPASDLEAYDRDLAEITDRLNQSRPADPIRWLYFQWVSLMFSAIYLDLYFRDRESLRVQLNAFLVEFNAKRKLALPEYTLDDLGRFSLWLATGAGKTLLLHANILQFRTYGVRHGARSADHTLVVVPNEALAKQHVGELAKSGIRARVYQKGEMEMYAGSDVLVLIITNILDPGPPAGQRKKPKEGDTLYDPVRFGKKNLILVDEGHRGKDDEGVWRRIRRYLAAQGFTFEYSATLKEVARPGLAALAEAVGDEEQGTGTMAREYARSIAVDYAFRRFHHDGYGKHFRVLTLAAAEGERELAMTGYLTGCLLAFYEQLMVFEESSALAAEHRIERPLAVFAGLRVTGANSEVLQSIELLGRFLAQRARFVALLRNLLDETLVVRTRTGANVFASMFSEVRRVHGTDAESVYEAMLRRLFLTEAGTKLRVARRKEATGEIQLRVGESEPFAVVNVGDPGEVVTELKKPAHDAWAFVEPDITGPSLFEALGSEKSSTTMLIGSRKFMEGWNSFRVSMLGIHNIGQGAGTQIVQLFGRGVRLRGKDGSLKRFSSDKVRERPGSDVERLRVLETISLFTVNAAYLAQFEDEVKEALETEPDGVPTTVEIPIIGDKAPPKLRVLKFPKPERFRETTRVLVGPDAGKAADDKRPVIDVRLDYYPRAGSRTSAGAAVEEAKASEYAISSLAPWSALLDHDALFQQCVRLKNERGWHNLKLPRFLDTEGGRVPLTRWLLEQPGWFRVSIERRFVDPDAVTDLGFLPTWQRLAGELVRAYVESVYVYHQRAWQTVHAKVVWWEDLDEADKRALVPEGQFSPEGALHRVSVTVKPNDGGKSEEVVQFVRDIAAEVAAGSYDVGRKHGLRSIGALRSLYRPLLGFDDGAGITIRCQPVALNKGEEGFVDKLEEYVKSRPAALAGAHVHLLRNESRRGTGFFVGAGFYPDFIVWIEREGKQWVLFVDPKGATHMATRAAAAKLVLPSLLWDIERRNGLPDVRLDAFLVFGTREKDLDDAWVRDHADRVVFAEQPDYVERMFSRAMGRRP